MRIIFLGDTHFGMRNSNKVLEDMQNKFYNELFFPYIDEHNISTVIQFGDWFDNRKWINLQTLSNCSKVFIEPAQERKLDVHVLVGNHDIPLRASLDMSSPDQLLSREEGFTVYSENTVVEFQGYKIGLCPWICSENYEDSIDFISRPQAEILIGHFEIDGGKMMAGHNFSGGLNASIFKNWKQVYSGHFHSQSKIANIHYIGTPYIMTWMGYGEQRGFWVFDTITEEIEFIRNPHSIFNKYWFNSGLDIDNFDYSNINNSWVKVIIEEKADFEKFERFIDRINYNKPHDLKVIESFEEYSSDNVREVLQLEDTKKLLSEYIDETATDQDKEAIKDMMLDIYKEAQELEID